MEHVTFLKNYKDDEKNRSSLNTLMQLNLGFSLEEWYARGFWEEQYIPYSFKDGAQVIANVSVYKQDVLYEGELRSGIRLEHIILHPQYHYKNLIEKLICYIIEEYKEAVDVIYLRADEAVTPFYPRLGFKHIEEIQNYIRVENICKGTEPEVVGEPEAIERIRQYPISYSLIGEELKSKNDFLRRSFEYMLDSKCKLYYFKEMDTYVMAVLSEECLEIKAILSEKEVDLDMIIAGFKIKYSFSKVKLGDEIQYKGSGEVVKEASESLLFIKEAPVKEENLFPIIIEA